MQVLERRPKLRRFLLSLGLLLALSCSSGADESDPLPDAASPEAVSDSGGLFRFGQAEPREITNAEERARAIKRGEYLTRAVAACGSCHGATLGDPDSSLSGGMLMEDRFGSVRAANITPDANTGIGAWGMADVMRAIRASIGRDGTPLSIDLHARYRWMSDADARAISLYVLSRPAVSQEVERRELGQFQRRRFWMFSQHRDFQGYVPTLPEQSTARWGRYLSYSVSGCYSCHTSSGGLISDGEAFAGNENTKRSLVGAVVGLFSLLRGELSEAKREDKDQTIQALLSREGGKELYGASANGEQGVGPMEADSPRDASKIDEAIAQGVFPIAGPDIRGTSSSGTGNWSEADIVRYLSSGEKQNNERSDPRACPWPYFSRMSESDKLAIARFLKSL